MIPSVAAFLVLGDVIVAAIYQSGRFTHADANYVWGILAGSTVGLLASTLGRLYSSTYYALKDTRTPLNYALIRVVLTTVLGYLSAIPLPHALGIDSRWGVAGLTISAGISSWIEFTLLRRTLNRRIGATGLSSTYLAKGWGAALVAAGNWPCNFASGGSSQPHPSRDCGPRPVWHRLLRRGRGSWPARSSIAARHGLQDEFPLLEYSKKCDRNNLGTLNDWRPLQVQDLAKLPQQCVSGEGFRQNDVLGLRLSPRLPKPEYPDMHTGL